MMLAFPQVMWVGGGVDDETRAAREPCAGAGWNSLPRKAHSTPSPQRMACHGRIRGIGFVADLHGPEYGPVSRAGNMVFINMDGTLRKHHEVFNEY